MHENHVFFLPINLPHSQCGVPASWAAQHTTVCFDSEAKAYNNAQSTSSISRLSLLVGYN